jgi:hypothetical protein
MSSIPPEQIRSRLGNYVEGGCGESFPARKSWTSGSGMPSFYDACPLKILYCIQPDEIVEFLNKSQPFTVVVKAAASYLWFAEIVKPLGHLEASQTSQEPRG